MRFTSLTLYIIESCGLSIARQDASHLACDWRLEKDNRSALLETNPDHSRRMATYAVSQMSKWYINNNVGLKEDVPCRLIVHVDVNDDDPPIRIDRLLNPYIVGLGRGGQG